MQPTFKIAGFIVIWGCTLGATYLVWTGFGAVAGVLFFLFGAGFAGFAGMLILVTVAKLLGLRIED